MIEIKIDDGDVTRLLNTLIQSGQDMSLPMRAIAEAIRDQTEENFARESGPLGKCRQVCRPAGNHRQYGIRDVPSIRRPVGDPAIPHQAARRWQSNGAWLLSVWSCHICLTVTGAPSP
jgi:phage gpG-like protein